MNETARDPAHPVFLLRLRHVFDRRLAVDAGEKEAGQQRGGTRLDPPGGSGLAHLFEHLLFDSGDPEVEEGPRELLQDSGGGAGAYTTPDALVLVDEIRALEARRTWRMADVVAAISGGPRARMLIEAASRPGPVEPGSLLEAVKALRPAPTLPESTRTV